MVTKIPQVYRTNDGGEFDTKAAADKHEAMIEAKREFENAQAKFAKAVVGTYKTADGEQFEFRWSQYWYIRDSFSFPALHPVRLEGWYDQEFCVDNSGKFFVVERSTDRKHESRYDVTELYKDERKARAALADAMQERIKQYRQQLAELRKSLS